MEEHTHHSGRHRRQHSRSMKRRPSYRKFEKFLIRNVFMLLGIAFFLAGMVYIASQPGEGNSLLKSILAFLTSAGQAEPHNTVFAFSHWSILLWSLPGLILLVLPFFSDKLTPAFEKNSVFIGTLWVLSVNIKVLSFDFIKTGTCYPTLWVGMAVTLALSLLPLWHAYRMKHGSLQLLIILLYYISLLFLINDYEWHYYRDFLFLFLFTGIVFFLVNKTGKLAPFFCHYFLTLLLVAIFWLRRLVMRDSGDVVLPYIVISSLFYITFFISGLLTDLSKRKAVVELGSVILMMINTLFYWGSNLFIFQKYGYMNLQGPFTLFLALFNGTLIYFSPKLNSEFTRSIYMLLTIFFLSMTLPLAIHQNEGILFLSVLSVLLIVYAKYAENRIALSGSFLVVGMMMLMFIYKCVSLYFPGFYEGAVPVKRALFGDGVLSGIFIVAALLINHRVMKNEEIHLTKKWFTRRSYRRFLKILLLVTLYLTAFWCWNFLFALMFPIEEAKMISWFSFTCLYMIILIPVLVRQRSSLRNGAFVLAALTLLAYPLLVNLPIAEIRNKGLETGGVYISCFNVHFLILLEIVVLMVTLYYYLMIARQNKRIVTHAFQAFAIVYILVLLLFEYDHIMVYFGYTGKPSISEMVFHNHLLPWSIIILFTSLALAIFSVIWRHRFIRQISFILFVAALAKIFVLDFAFLGDPYKVAILLVLSVFMISFSFLYQRFRKAG